MWELPNREGNATPAQVVEFLSEQCIETISCKPCGEAKHVFTHVEWHMHGYVAECNGESEHFLWKNAEEIQEEYAIPSAFRFYTRLMTKDVPRGLD